MNGRNRTGLVVALLVMAAAAAWFRFTTLGERMTHVDDSGFLLHVPFYGSAAGAGDFIAKFWTYAPGQYYFFYWLWSGVNSWPELLYAGRLPSALLATLGSLLFIWLIWKLRAESGYGSLTGILAGALGMLSMRLMVESQQGYSYAVSFPLAVGQLVWMITCFLRSDSLQKQMERAVAGILAIGAVAVWFNYQMVPMTVAAAGACIFVMIRGKRTSAEEGESASPDESLLHKFGPLLGSAMLFAVSLVVLWVKYLGARVQANRGVPGWAAFELLSRKEAGGTAQYLLLLLRKFPDLFAVAAGPVWAAQMPSYATLLVGLALVAVAGYGIHAIWKSSARALFALSAYGVFCIGLLFIVHMLGMAPFGITRHSFVLFAPVLACVLAGEMALCSDAQSQFAGTWRKVFAAASGLALIAFIIGFPGFDRLTVNRLDLEALKRIAGEQRAVAVIGMDWTWDPTIRQSVTKNKICDCFVGVDDVNEGIKRLEAAEEGSILFVSHRADPMRTPRKEDLLKNRPSWYADQIVASPALGATEPWGVENGGNGFFVTAITKPAPPSASCEVRMASGWFDKKTSDGSAWTYASNGRSQMTMSSPVPVNVRFTASVNATAGGGQLRVLANDKQAGTFTVPGNIALDLKGDAGYTRFTWIMGEGSANTGFQFVNPRVEPGCTMRH